MEQGRDQKLRGCEALERIGQLSDMHVYGEQEGTQMCFLPNKGSLCWALVGRSCVHPGPFGEKATEQRTLLDRIFFDERLAVGMVDSLALRR